MSDEAQNALKQIEEKQYAAALKAQDVKAGQHIGLAFCGKHFEMIHQRVVYPVTNRLQCPSSHIRTVTSPTPQTPFFTQRTPPPLVASPQTSSANDRASQTPSDQPRQPTAP